MARESEIAYIGRVTSLVMLAFGAFGLMALPYGYLADWVGECNTLIVMGVSVLLVSRSSARSCCASASSALA